MSDTAEGILLGILVLVWLVAYVWILCWIFEGPERRKERQDARQYACRIAEYQARQSAAADAARRYRHGPAHREEK